MTNASGRVAALLVLQSGEQSGTLVQSGEQSGTLVQQSGTTVWRTVWNSGTQVPEGRIPNQATS